MGVDDAGWPAAVREWRKAQDAFYAAAMADMELYMTAISLIRAIVDDLADISDEEALLRRFSTASAHDVYPTAERLDDARVIFLDYDLALAAAYYRRAQEIREEALAAHMQANIEAAKRAGQTWVVLVNEEAQRKGLRFFDKLEMNLNTGNGLRTAAELDWEKGRVFVLEPIMLDRQTGRAQREIKLEHPKQGFRTEAELNQAADALRRHYSAHEEMYGTVE